MRAWDVLFLYALRDAPTNALYFLSGGNRFVWRLFASSQMSPFAHFTAVVINVLSEPVRCSHSYRSILLLLLSLGVRAPLCCTLQMQILKLLRIDFHMYDQTEASPSSQGLAIGHAQGSGLTKVFFSKSPRHVPWLLVLHPVRVPASGALVFPPRWSHEAPGRASPSGGAGKQRDTRPRGEPDRHTARSRGSAGTSACQRVLPRWPHTSTAHSRSSIAPTLPSSTQSTHTGVLFLFTRWETEAQRACVTCSRPKSVYRKTTNARSFVQIFSVSMINVIPNNFLIFSFIKCYDLSFMSLSTSGHMLQH